MCVCVIFFYLRIFISYFFFKITLVIKNTKCVEEKQNINRRRKIKKEQGIKRSEIFIKLINLPYPCIYKSHAHEVLQIHTHKQKQNQP